MTQNISRIILSGLLTILVLSTVYTAFANDKSSVDKEWKVLEPARELWQNRKYEEAREQLTHIARENNVDEVGIDVESLQELLKRAQGVVEEGYSTLDIKIGRTYPVPLKGGGKLSGKVEDVDDEKIVIESNDREHEIELDRIDIERIIRLSALEYSPDIGKNQAVFAVLYIMEDKQDKAQESLDRAIASDYDPQDEQQFVRWAQNIRDTQAQTKQRGPQDVEEENSDDESSQAQEDPKEHKEDIKKISVLVDRIHGNDLPSVIRRELEKHNVKIEPTNRKSYDPKKLKEASLLILVENTSSDPISRDNTKYLTKFLQSGGGLIYFGARREKDAALEPLLKAANADIFYDRLRVDIKAPDEVPKGVAVAGPSGKHPVTRNVGPVVFPLNTCIIDIKRKNAFLVSSQHVESTKTDISPVVLGASFSLGQGKIVVFGTVPDLYHRETKKSARRMILNAVAWAKR